MESGNSSQIPNMQNGASAPMPPPIMTQPLKNEVSLLNNVPPSDEQVLTELEQRRELFGNNTALIYPPVNFQRMNEDVDAEELEKRRRMEQARNDDCCTDSCCFCCVLDDWCYCLCELCDIFLTCCESNEGGGSNDTAGEVADCDNCCDDCSC